MWPALYELMQRTYMLIGAERMLRTEVRSKAAGEPPDIPTLLARGRLKEALFQASNAPDPVIRRRFRQLQELLRGQPLQRRPFVVTHDPGSNEIQIVESLDESEDMPREVPLDLAGLGIAQVYRILAQMLLHRARCVAIEEPEAHLHAPSTGMHLRALLDRLVGEHYIDQLFVATHSNLFDLDPEGYWDVSHHGERGTVVERRPLQDIDLRHLYEPGPAKHALAGFLHYMAPDTVVFRRGDGTPVSIAEMRDMLQRDDPLAREFLEDVHAAAVRAVRVKHRSARGT
jgi:hypothetical protein